MNYALRIRRAFILGDLSKVSYACADASMWTGIGTKESVEPLVHCVDDPSISIRILKRDFNKLKDKIRNIVLAEKIYLLKLFITRAELYNK